MTALEQLTGRPEDDRGKVQRYVESSLRSLDAHSIPYTATPADWVAPVPTTVGEALDRIAAAGGTHPVP